MPERPIPDPPDDSTPISTHRDILLATARSVIEAGKHPNPMIAAFDGGRWVGAAIVKDGPYGPDWETAGRWAYGLDADNLLVLADAELLTTEAFDAQDALLVLQVNLCAVLDAWAMTYAEVGGGGIGFGDVVRVKPAPRSGPAIILSAALRDDLASVAG